MLKSVALLMLTVLLPACGLKGPLYLPPQKPAVSQPAPTQPASDVRADDRKSPAQSPTQ